MKRQIPILIFIIFNLLFFLQCEQQPTAPEYNNPLDPNNPATGGDPFDLQAEIAGGGITLNWTLLNISAIEHYTLFKKADTAEFQLLYDTPDDTISSFIDTDIQNGHLYTYYVIAVDNQGVQINSNYTQVEINSSPIVSIDDNNGYTTSRTVNLTLIAFGADSIIIVGQDLVGGGWQDYSASVSIVLPQGSGEKIVGVEFGYSNGEFSDMVYDTTAPQPMNPLVVINDDSIYTSLRDVELALQAPGALWMRITNDTASTSPAASGLSNWGLAEIPLGKSAAVISNAAADWIPFVSSTDWQLSAGEGEKLVWVDFKNDFEIIETAVDTILPQPLEAEFNIDHDSLYTSDREVYLFPQAQGVDIICMFADNEAFNGSAWMPMPDSAAFQLALGPGPKTVYARFRSDFEIVENLNDNIEPAPINPSLNINHNEVFTAANDVWIFPSAQGVGLWCKFSEDSTFTGLSWNPIADSVAFQLSPGNSTKTVYGKFVNTFQIESAVVFDNIDPMAIYISVRIANDSDYINTNTAPIVLNGSGILRMILHDTPDSTGLAWENYQSIVEDYNFSPGDGLKYVYGWFCNSFNTIGPLSDSVFVDTYCQISSFNCSQNAGDTLTAGDTLYMEMTVSDDNIGPDTGGAATATLPGVFTNLTLNDNLDGVYSAEYIIQSDDYCLNDSIYCNFTDRAGNVAPEDVSAFPWPILTYWETALGTAADDEGYCAFSTVSNSYIVCGNTNSGDLDILLIKSDANGNELWQRTIDLGGDESANSICQASDGGYVICGFTNNGSHPGLDVSVMKVDSDGNQQWHYTFGGNYNDVGYSVIPAVEGGYVVSGYYSPVSGGFNADFYLIKIDETGHEVWSQTYGGDNTEICYQVIQTTDGGYALVGCNNSTSFGYLRLIKTDNQGEQQWARSYLSSPTSAGYGLVQCADGGYLLTGSTYSFTTASTDLCIVKTDASGNEIWSDTFGNSNEDIGYGVARTSDGYYIVAGIIDDDVWLRKIDPPGTEIWTRTYGGSSLDYARCIRTSLDGGAVVAGTTESFGAGGADFYLIKISPE